MMDRAKILIKELEELEPRGFEPHKNFPTHLNMAFTYRCKAACPHCYFLQKDEKIFSRNRELLEESLFRKVLVHPGSGDLKRMSCGGGEALLHQDIFEFIDIAHEKGIQWVQLITNGMSLLEDSIDEKLRENIGKYDNLLVSLDAADEQNYARAKGLKKAPFSDICSRIKELIDFRGSDNLPVIGVGFVIGNHNVADVERMIGLSEELGFDFCHFTTLHLAKNSDEDRGFETIDQIPVEYKKVINLTNYKIDIIIQMPVIKNFSDYYCSSLANHLSVSPEGNLAPCCHIPWDEEYGNMKLLKGSSFEEQKIEQIREKFLKASKEAREDNLHIACIKCNRRLKGLIKFHKNISEWRVCKNL